MTIEQAQHLRVVWQSREFPDCRHPTAEQEYYPGGEPTGLLVCSNCGDYLEGDSGNLTGTGDVL